MIHFDLDFVNDFICTLVVFSVNIMISTFKQYINYKGTYQFQQYLLRKIKQNIIIKHIYLFSLPQSVFPCERLCLSSTVNDMSVLNSFKE